jgi:hypothetical protein
VELLRSHGLEAYRVPLSGAATGFKSDVEVRLGDQTFRLESKVKSKGFSRIYKWLANADFVVLKADREKPLAVIPLDVLCQLAARTLAKPTEKVTGESKSKGYELPSEEYQHYSKLPAFLTRSTKII